MRRDLSAAAARPLAPTRDFQTENTLADVGAKANPNESLRPRPLRFLLADDLNRLIATGQLRNGRRRVMAPAVISAIGFAGPRACPEQCLCDFKLTQARDAVCW